MRSDADANNNQDKTKAPVGIPYPGKEEWSNYVFHVFSPFLLAQFLKKKDDVIGQCKLCNSYVRASLLATSKFNRHMECYHKPQIDDFESK